MKSKRRIGLLLLVVLLLTGVTSAQQQEIKTGNKPSILVLKVSATVERLVIVSNSPLIVSELTEKSKLTATGKSGSDGKDLNMLYLVRRTSADSAFPSAA